jgi:hypothetical protein
VRKPSLVTALSEIGADPDASYRADDFQPTEDTALVKILIRVPLDVRIRLNVLASRRNSSVQELLVKQAIPWIFAEFDGRRL